MAHVPVLIDHGLVRLPNGREVNLRWGLVAFEPSPSQYVARYVQRDTMIVEGARADTGAVEWRIITHQGVHVSLCNNRHTVMLPRGSATFKGQIQAVHQIQETFAVLVAVPGGTARFVPHLPRWEPPPYMIVALDASAKERWRRYGYFAILGYPNDTQIIAKDELARVWLDPRTGKVLDTQQSK